MNVAFDTASVLSEGGGLMEGKRVTERFQAIFLGVEVFFRLAI